MNKTKLLEIAHALDLGSIDDKKAQTLLLGLLGVVGQSEQLPCDYCGDFEDGHGICETQCDYCKSVKGF